MTNTTLNKDRVELWVQALESDGYQQCAGNLRWNARSGETMHCAEGVAMAVAEMHGVRIYPAEWGGISMPPQVYRWYGFIGNIFVEDRQGILTTVIAANDQGRMSFWDIAQALRAKWLKDQG